MYALVINSMIICICSFLFNLSSLEPIYFIIVFSIIDCVALILLFFSFISWTIPVRFYSSIFFSPFGALILREIMMSIISLRLWRTVNILALSWTASLTMHIPYCGSSSERTNLSPFYNAHSYASCVLTLLFSFTFAVCIIYLLYPTHTFKFNHSNKEYLFPLPKRIFIYPFQNDSQLWKHLCFLCEVQESIFLNGNNRVSLFFSRLIIFLATITGLM